MTEQQERKRAIRMFFRDHYTDERLAQLLAHAQDGKLAYNSCCCFIGIATVNHAMKVNIFLDPISKEPGGGDRIGMNAPHYQKATLLPGARRAEMAFRNLGPVTGDDIGDDNIRRRILIPMVRAEMRRRALAAQQAIQAESPRVAERVEEAMVR